MGFKFFSKKGSTCKKCIIRRSPVALAERYAHVLRETIKQVEPVADRDGLFECWCAVNDLPSSYFQLMEEIRQQHTELHKDDITELTDDKWEQILEDFETWMSYATNYERRNCKGN